MGGPEPKIALGSGRASFAVATHTFRRALADTLPLRREVLADLAGHHHRTRADESRRADDLPGVAVEGPGAAAHARHQHREEEHLLRDAKDQERQQGMHETPDDDDEEEQSRVEDHERGLRRGRHIVLGHVVHGLPHLVKGGMLESHEQDLRGEEAETEPLEGVDHGEQAELGVTVGRELGHEFAPPKRGRDLKSGGRVDEMTKSKCYSRQHTPHVEHGHTSPNETQHTSRKIAFCQWRHCSLYCINAN